VRSRYTHQFTQRGRLALLNEIIVDDGRNANAKKGSPLLSASTATGQPSQIARQQAAIILYFMEDDLISALIEGNVVAHYAQQTGFSDLLPDQDPDPVPAPKAAGRPSASAPVSDKVGLDRVMTALNVTKTHFRQT